MRLVVALGGNALLPRGAPQEEATQRERVRAAARALAPLAASHELVLTHGNGPQVGLLALESEAYEAVAPYSLDILGAESQGMTGYLLADALHDELPARQIAPLLTQVIVDRADPAFEVPSKPVGPVYEQAEAERLADERGWSVAPDGDRWRRVVPSPEPQAILELPTIELLVDAGVVVICAGGGGVPIRVDASGATEGVEAVVDKDLTAALLAVQLGADALLLLTDVGHVFDGWATDDERPIQEAPPAALRAIEFAPGSMAPKVLAACRFVEATGHEAYIGALTEASAILEGDAGTRVSLEAEAISYRE